MLSDVSSNDFTVLRVGMSKNVLDQVVAVLIACNVDEWDTWTIQTTLTDTIEVAAQEINTSNLEALLNNLGGKLISAVLGGIADDMVNSTAAVGWSTVFADMLDAPVAELAMSDDVNAGKNFLNAWTLMIISIDEMGMGIGNLPCHPRGNSQRCFGRPNYQSRREQPHATYQQVLR